VIVALEFSGVSHRYGARLALANVSFAVGKGELVCLVGPSGCGKTTALRVAAGLEAPFAGTVSLDGRVVSGPGIHVAPERRRVGYMSQDLALFPHLDVQANVEFGLDDRPAAGRSSRAREMLAKVGMADYADAWPHKISGGQQQRVALARALAPEPKVMLLDEPFSSLDRRLRDSIWEESISILRETGVATLMVTHDPEEAMAMADRIAVMRDGRIVQTGTQEELYDRPKDAYVARLFGEVNAFPGTVRGGAVATALGPIAAPGIAEGAQVEVLVRPEALRAVADTAGGARVVEAKRLGSALALRLALDGLAPLNARLPRGAAPAEGTIMALTLDTAGVFVFPAGG
jgi:iron(III) transport system ATP-binding protein